MQTETRRCARGAFSRSQSISSGSGRRVPSPPGTRSVCGPGAAASEVSGTIGEPAGGPYRGAVHRCRADRVRGRVAGRTLAAPAEDLDGTRQIKALHSVEDDNEHGSFCHGFHPSRAAIQVRNDEEPTFPATPHKGFTTYRPVGNISRMSTLPARSGRHCHHALNPMHSTLYFSPDFAAEYAGGSASRTSAPHTSPRARPRWGLSAPGAVAATFYNFNHELIAQHLPAVWDIASPEVVLDARLRIVNRTLRRLLGDEVDRLQGVGGGRRAGAARHQRPAPGTPGRCMPRTPICPCPPSPISRTGTPRPCCASTVATAISPLCSRPGSTPSKRW